MSQTPLNIAIDARLFSGKSGGIEQVAIGLIDALSKLTDGDETYTVLAYPVSNDWIRPYIKGPCKLLITTAVKPPPKWKTWLKRHDAIPRLGQHAGGWLARKSVTLSHSDGTIENAGVDIIHFIMQRAFFTQVPSLYHPHDLQHIHLPQFFSRRERVKRDVMLRSFCAQAQIVPVTSSWVKRDLMKQFGLSDTKVTVVPLTGALQAYPTPTPQDLSATAEKFKLPADFIFYPAQTWPHKNHLNLLNAIQLLKEKGMTVPLVCSGHQTPHFSVLQDHIKKLGLANQTTFAGFVSPVELQALYRLCRCVVIPTLFEAASGPLNEAFQAGASAACSNVTSLPEQAQDAALVFDPHDPKDIAANIEKLWNDSLLRQTFKERGLRIAGQFTWDRTARHFRALYRKLGDRRLTDDDRHLLTAPPGI